MNDLLRSIAAACLRQGCVAMPRSAAAVRRGVLTRTRATRRPTPRGGARDFIHALALVMLLTLSCGTGHAQGPDADGVLDSARQRLDADRKALSSPLSEADLSVLRIDAISIGAEADATVARVQPQLTSSQAQLDQLGSSSAGEAPEISTLRATLGNSRTAWLTQVRFARLLSLESAQFLLRIETVHRAQVEASLNTKVPSLLAPAFWSELRSSAGPEAGRLAALGTEIAVAARAVPLSVDLATVAGVFALVALGLWGRRAAQRLASTVVPSGRLRRSFDAWASIGIGVAVPGLICLVLRTGLASSGALSQATEALLDDAIGVVCFGAYALGLGRVLLRADRPSWRLLAVPDSVANGLRHVPACLAALVVVGWLSNLVAARVNSSDAIVVAVRCISALALGLGMTWAQMRGERLRRLHASVASDDEAVRRPLWAALLGGVVWFGLVASLLCLLLGYVALGTLMIKQFAWIALVVGSTYLLNTFIEDASQAFIAGSDAEDRDDPEHAAGGRSGLRAQAAVLLSGCIKVVVIAAGAILVVTTSGESPSDVLRRAVQWGGGWSVGEVKVRPRAVIEAVMVLVLGLLAVAVIKRWLGRRYLPTTGLAKDMQTSTVTMFGYAGVVTAVITALSASGIGLDRVAWIASALSVGIGFGLQGVTQNFISGLVLLAERPVKVGDWVSLGAIEGDIRQINLRATEVELGDRSTVIVPNSEFITKAVRNVTRGDPVGLVQFKLPMPLNTDVDLVRDTVLAAFASHADLLAEPAPGVSLDGIEGDHLVFNATGFVASPRLAYAARSAVLFDILNRLREAGVQMSAPPTMLLHSPDRPGPPIQTGTNT